MTKRTFNKLIKGIEDINALKIITSLLHSKNQLQQQLDETKNRVNDLKSQLVQFQQSTL